MQDKRVRNVIETNSVFIKNYANKVINKVSEISNNMSRPVKVTLSYAKKCIEDKYWPGTAGKDKNKESEFQTLIIKKLILLLYKNLMFPII